MNKNDNSTDSKVTKRGPKEKFSDIQMKELAIKIKKKNKQKELTYSLLEKETKISRNTWKRRLESFIQELNRPIIRDAKNIESDEIYFPNIESIFEAYGDNKLKIINELHHFEILFQDLYGERNELLKDLKKLENSKEIIDNQNKRIIALKNEVAHYKMLYEQIIVSSVDINSRKKLGLKNNLIEFNKDIQKNLSLTNFNEHFPEVSMEDVQRTEVEDNLSKLKNKFDKLF